ncbi:MAG: ABC transporter ATP-binding protein [Nitrososphaeria archaeon]
MNDSITPFISMMSIGKIYPDGTTALTDVHFKVERGEIVGLLGENGAGKTTLMKILSGLLQPTSGKIIINGESVNFKNPIDALSRGIGIVHQHFALVPIYSVLENIILGQEGVKNSIDLLSSLKLERAREKIHKLIEITGLEVPLDAPVGSLSLGIQQRVEILKVLYRGIDVLILDEPTSFLTPQEVKELFQIMKNLKKDNKSVIFITHKLKEVLEATDRIVVLRNGSVVGETLTSKASPESLALMMVGREFQPPKIEEKGFAGKDLLKVDRLTVKSDFDTLAVKEISFDLKEGEIFAVAGVEGNGQAELVEALTGLRKAESGKISVGGFEVTNKNPIELFRAGMVHIPADRHKHGLVLDFSIAENSILGRQWEPDFLLTFSRLNLPRIRELASRIMKEFNVIAPSIDTVAKSLSGGNQQRLIVGRELSKRNVKLIIAVHPTRGLDIASTFYMHEVLIKMKTAGKGILLVSADLDEIMELSDRIAVIYEGKFLDIKRTSETTKEEIGLLMGGINQ